VLRCRVIASLAREIAVGKSQMQYSVPWTSLSWSWNCNDRHAPCWSSTFREAERIVAADRDQVVEPQVCDVNHYQWAVRSKIPSATRMESSRDAPAHASANQASRILRGLVREVVQHGFRPARSMSRVIVFDRGGP